MANRNTPMGFLPVRHFTSGMPLRMSTYNIASGYAANIFSGSPVILTATNNRIIVGTANGPVVGVFMGVTYPAADGSVVFSKHWPTSTVTRGTVDATAWVYDDPDTVFEVQWSGSTTPANTIFNKSYQINNPGAGGAATGLSTADLATTAGANVFHAMHQVDRADNQLLAYVKLFGMFNLHQRVNGGAARFVSPS